MVNALVVFCHPTHDSFTGAMLERVRVGLSRAGHDVRVLDLYAEGFDPELSRGGLSLHRVDHRTAPDRRADLVEHIDALRSADVLVVVYPTWWAGQPAMLTGWFDRVWVQGVAWDLPEGAARIRPLLVNIRRIVAVTSHGSSKLVNALEGEGGKRVITRALRGTCSRRCRTTWLALYGIDRSTPSRRLKFLDRIERTMARL